jgi:hypothetical protein
MVDLNNCDGLCDHRKGVCIFFSDKRMASFDKEKKELDAEFHRKFIFGGQVAAYMKA